MNWSQDERETYQTKFSDKSISITFFRGKFHWTVMQLDEEGNSCLVENGSSTDLETAKSESVSFARSCE